MIAKNFVFVLLAAILTLSFASALTIDSYSFNNVNQSASINVANNYNESLAVSVTPVTTSGFTFSATPTSFNLANGSNQALTLALTNVPSGLTFGTYTVATLNAASNVSTQNSSSTISYVKSFCKNGAVNTSNLSIYSVKITNDGIGKKDEWHLLDNITVDVRVEAGDYDVKDVSVVMGLYDSSGKNVVGDLIFSNSDEQTIDLGDFNNGDKDTASFEFNVPADMSPDDYKLVVKTYSKKTGESSLCDDVSSDLSDNTYQSISVKEETDKGKYILFDNSAASPFDVTCGDSVVLNTNVYNVGRNDESKVKVHLISTDFNLDQSYEITKGLNKGDNSRVSFSFVVPSNVTAKTYNLRLSSEYDYRNSQYKQESDDDTLVPIKVIACAKNPVINVQDNSTNTDNTDNTNTDTESSSFSSIFKGNSLIWVIGLVNLILIILIIIVAVKVARR